MVQDVSSAAWKIASIDDVDEERHNNIACKQYRPKDNEYRQY